MVKKVPVVRKAAKKAGKHSPKVIEKAMVVELSAAAKKTKTKQEQSKLVVHRQEPQTLEQQLAQREDELAILNSVGEAMAKTLDVKTVTKIVGDKVREIFHSNGVSIMLLNAQTNMIHVHYEYDEGEGGYVDYIEPFPLGKGLTTKVIQSCQPLLLGTAKDQAAKGAYVAPELLEQGSGVLAESMVFVPIIVGEKVIGVVSVSSYKQYAFNESHVRLLQTLSANMGVAIENARLFEAEQERVAELAIINSVQEGLASKLDIQGIYDLVGNKLYEIFKPDILFIAIHHPEKNITSFPYGILRGEKIGTMPDLELGGFTGEAIRKRQTLVISEDIQRRSAEVNSFTMAGDEEPQSMVYVPIIAGENVLGVVSLQSYDRGHIFPDSDVRLLETLTNSMSVALQNAQSFKAEQERVAELQIINSIQQGLAAELDFQAIVDLVGDKLREVFNTKDFGIRWYDEKTDLVHFLYEYEHDKRLTIPSQPLAKTVSIRLLKEARQPVIANTAELSARTGGEPLPGTDMSKSIIIVPIISSDRLIGSLQMEDYERENAYGESVLRLLTTIAASLGTALENARLFDETQRLFKAEQERVAELQIINSIQQGLAAELDFQAIVDLVGDKLSEVLNTGDLGISWYDEKTNLIHYLYEYEHGERLSISPRPPYPGGQFETILKTRKSIIWNTSAEYTGDQLPGTDQSKSLVTIPIISSDRVLGSITIENYERENAFGESELRLLTTIAASLGTALENARLFDETQRLLKITEDRAAELAIINSVQEGLASKLDMQAIYELVGDKLAEVMNILDIDIRLFVPETQQVLYPYLRDQGKRMEIPAQPLRGISKHVYETCQTVIINEKMAERMEELGSQLIPGTQMEKSYIAVPIMVGGRALGLVSTSNYERENAFGDSDVRLLQTVVSAMSVALENARLFDETQRLLKETEQRAAELAIINSVQEGLASKLDMQAIYDLVGDKIRDMFNAQSVIISSFDHEKKIARLDYAFEDNARVYDEELLPFSTMNKHLIATRQPVVINENSAETAREYGLTTIEGTRAPKSLIYVPFGTGTQVNGYFSLQNMDRENAFAESDVHLLQTLAGSMGIALENARLFNAEQQRAAELAVINSIQQGLAAELDFQTIIDLVGDKLREVLNTGEIGIRWYDAEANLIHYLYEYEHNERITIASATPGNKIWESLVLTRKPIILNTPAEGFALGVTAVPGTDQSKSAVYIPIVGSDRVLGIIVTEDYENENAYTEADIRLLSTVASSMGVALENARLFNETQQRNAELAIINSVQQGLASKLEFQSIIDLIGDKVTEIFNAQATLISLYNPEKAEIDHKYLIERGERIYFNKPVAIDRFRQRVVDTRQPWLINQNYKETTQELGEAPVLEGEEPKSLLFVPMIVGSGVTGVISLQNLDTENAFSESDVRLLSTIASSMSVALENARLFEAEQQRVAELAIINSVQQGLASKLDMQAIYDLVGNKIGEIFSLHTCYIMLYDREKGIEHYPFLVDNGKRVVQEDLPHDENGFGPLVMKTLQPIMINEDMEGRSKAVGSYNISDDGDEVKSAIYVPLMIGSEARGVISVQNTQRENAFSDSDLRLLTTLASSMSVALESARLFVETEQRAAELATINSIQEGLASKLEPQAIYDLVGEKLREVFGAQFLYIAIHDRETNLIHFPYFWERDHREITEEPIRFGEGLTSRVIETRHPIVINTDWLRRATELGGVFLDGELPKSSMSVPIMSGNTAIGVISLQSTVAENQYSESEVRLLSTIASSVGVALESARLFEETEQRAAELAIINGVQEGLASKLEVHAIYELIGEKLRDLFGNLAISLVTFDLKKDIHHYEYIVEKGQRLEVEDSPITLTGRHIIRTRQTLLVNDHIVENLAKIGITMQIIPGTETPKSLLRVPILIGDRVHGFIGLSDLDRENAFSPSDVRLLQTLAGSLSVALENARLFEETNRNAAELATVNTVSSALASELDIDPLIQLVGEQTRTIFGADIVYVALLDETGKTINFPYTFGEDLPPMNFGEGLTSKIIQTGIPLLLNQDVDKKVEELGATSVGVSSQSYLGVPIFVGGRAVGVLSVQSLIRQGVFDENAGRLLTTIASNVGSALQNARLYREAQESRAAAEQANKAKSAFLANMSHELRTPLNAIIGFTRIVRRKAEGALPEKQTDNLDKVLFSAEHLLSLINTVLDIAKIEAGRMEVQASNFNISALADQCANTATPLLKPNVRLDKEVDPDLTLVHSDQDKIKQIVLNLLSNAAKFTHEGSIVLRVRRVEANLVVDVTDSGIGISEEALGRIFEEFQQADTSTTRQYGGTGLGLAISRNLARLLGGDLTATSDGLPGRGSTFTLTMPMQYGFRSASATKPETELTTHANHLLRADASKKLILVIDDDPDAVYLMQENLNPQEFEVIGTRNGLEGQQMARDLQPQAILLDIIMPDKDGWQVLHDLKADEGTKDIPVILLTIVDKKALGFQLGASAYLLKPLDPAAVLDALKQVTSHDGNGHIHVLIVDDDPHVADMLRQTLPESTFTLDSAEDGVAGLQAIEAHRPDVVLLDIMMPRLDGFGVIEQLRASEATRDLPIIVISARELTDEEMKTLEERVDFVMKKQGFDGEKLMQEINSVLEK